MSLLRRLLFAGLSLIALTSAAQTTPQAGNEFRVADQPQAVTSGKKEDSR